MRSTFPRTRSSSSSSSSSSQKRHARFSFRPLKKHGTQNKKQAPLLTRAKTREILYPRANRKQPKCPLDNALRESRNKPPRSRPRRPRKLPSRECFSFVFSARAFRRRLLFAYFCRSEDVRSSSSMMKTSKTTNLATVFLRRKRAKRAKRCILRPIRALVARGFFRDAVSRAVFSSRREKAPFRKQQQHNTFLFSTKRRRFVFSLSLSLFNDVKHAQRGR